MRVTYKELLGKVVLAGLTYTTEDGDFAGQTEFWGTVTQANKKGIVIQQPDGETFTFPPDLSAFSAARPGEYRLRTTNEVVSNPDYLTTWTITKPN